MTREESESLGNDLFNRVASGREIGAALIAADRKAREECAWRLESEAAVERDKFVGMIISRCAATIRPTIEPEADHAE